MRGSRADAEPLLLPPPRLRPLSAGGGRGACAFAGRGDRRSRGGDARHGSALKSASRGVLGGAGCFVKGEMKRGSFQSPCWFGLPSTICAGAAAFGSDIDIISLAAAWIDPTTLSARLLLALLEECNRDASNDRATYGLATRSSCPVAETIGAAWPSCASTGRLCSDRCRQRSCTVIASKSASSSAQYRRSGATCSQIRSTFRELATVTAHADRCCTHVIGERRPA